MMWFTVCKIQLKYKKNMQKGKVSVNTENIFPIIKKFLYTDNEIFVRELVSNATDACGKLSVLAKNGTYNEAIDALKISVSIDEKKKTLTISDNGIGMTSEEIDKYINQIAFSGAEEFVNTYENAQDVQNIIGHFGLGFYSSFMVADKVEIQTKSYKDAEAAQWVCEGSTDFKISKGKRKKRGTDIILNVTDENKEFLEKWKITELLNKYCKFLPIPIEFDGKIINENKPIWKSAPSDLKDEDYTEFYSTLYPMSEPPLFWIHLNVDYPFNLSGVLFFPRIKKEIDPNRNKIQLYSNQVYVTDNVENIVPEYLMLLHGVLDSPDIPLNVSRSSLQADANVKKITSHISKKVSDKLTELYKADIEDYKIKWNNISLFVKYGLISDDKFYDRANGICLLKNIEKTHYTINDYLEKIAVNQTDKDGNKVVLYTNDSDVQHTYIENAKDYGYDILVLDEVIDQHFISILEQKNEKLQLKRVDADIVSQLIAKEEKNESILTEAESNQIKEGFQNAINKDTLEIMLTPSTPENQFITLTRSEWERRMSEMNQFGGMAMFGMMPEKYKVHINTNHPLAKKWLESGENEKSAILNNSMNLAKLSQGLLKGEELTKFIKEMYQKI